ncbi:hypothetical protein MRS44_017673 [Fusarium solani]|uniref:uncharacterized protein n=1 Tax=Fusarium solani TaxID=169388 RepID=UPI0032C4557D|nr:hypothetical protein MRS44_017673 [Fusarium solani]
MDTKLMWKAHIDEIERKVTKTTAALSSLGSSTWGVPMRELRTVYRRVAIPQMMYACSAWSNANWSANGESVSARVLRKLQSLQARGARVIGGAYRATSIPALNIETYLLPIEEQILKHNIDALGRIGPAQRSLPESAGNRQKRKSPRQAIEQTIRDLKGPNIRQQEQASAYITPPWWRGPRCSIEGNTKAAKQKHLEQLSEHTAIHVYTDGSGINGHVGAAAVCTTTQENRAAYMGTERISTVHAAELQGILLALQMAREDKQRGNTRSRVCIYTDNQAAIRSSAKPKGKPGAYLLKAIAQITEELQQNGLPVEIRWIPAHAGVWGNEQADKAAKEAIGWREGGANGPRAAEPSVLWALRSTLKMWTHKHVHKAWQKQMGQRKPGQGLLPLYAETNKRGITAAHETQQETKCTVDRIADREDSHQALPLQAKGTRRHGRQVPLRTRTTNGIAYPPAMPETSTTPEPGTRRLPRTKRPSQGVGRAQSSRESRQIHGTDRDPWASRGSKRSQTMSGAGGRL